MGGHAEACPSEMSWAAELILGPFVTLSTYTKGLADVEARGKAGWKPARREAEVLIDIDRE